MVIGVVMLAHHILDNLYPTSVDFNQSDCENSYKVIVTVQRK